MPLLLRAPPFPAQGGRSLNVRACGEVLPEFEPPVAGRSFVGRSFSVRGEVCAGAGRSEPKPCGARPRSVALPCASQVRELLPARTPELFPASVRADKLELPRAEGGRSCTSSRWRGVISDLAPEFAGALPARFSN